MPDASAIAIDLIRKKGTLRTPALAEQLGIGEAAVDAMLAPACARGELITCNVETGGRCVVEYRLSMTGGGKLVAYAPNAPHVTPAKRNDAARAAHFRAAREPAVQPTPATPAPTRETAEMTFKEKVSALFRKHGPMTSRELKKHHGISDASQMLNLIAGNGEFAKLGGTPKNTIFGLPDQKLSDRTIESTDKPPRSLHRGKAGKHPKKRAGGGSVAMRRKRALKAAKKAHKNGKFRPALAADGAILMLGAKRGDFEIPREQARGLVDLQRRLTPPEIADLVNFVTRLDNAEVGA